MVLAGNPEITLSGWRRAAVVNSVTVGCFAIVLLGILGRSIVEAGSLSKAWLFYEGDCEQSDRINLFLHLLLNIVSTLIIASSNFFMQVLNSPTREEVDRAHAKNRWLEIGVPSIGNIFHVSMFKTIAWVLFNLSSVPIHLLFNSAVFQTDYQGNMWQLTMASDAFIQGSKYYGPGAGLVLSGSDFGEQQPYQYAVRYGTGPHDVEQPEEELWNLQIDDYLGSQSLMGAYLTKLATNASSWKNMSAEACRNEYQTCQSRRQYRDVLMVLDVHGEPEGYDGWVLDDIYNMSGISNSTIHTSTNNDTYSSIWEPYLPLSEKNSLWFSGFCLSWALIGTSSQGYTPPACENWCAGPLGLTEQIFETMSNAYGSIETGTTLDGSAKRPSGNNWTVSWVHNTDESPEQNLSRPWYRDDGLANLDVRYCLVETEDPVCKVGLMTPLLAVTALCVLIKTLLCFVVVTKLSDQPLVTPGDAIESFIIHPDPTTVDKATMSAQDRSRGKFLSELAPGPRQWKTQWKYLASGVPKRAWARTYLLCLTVLGAVAGLMSTAISTESLANGGGLFDHDSNIQGGGLISGDFFTEGSMAIAVVTANLPQIALSLSYFSYNAIFTRLQAESEWNSFSVDYKPLRVTSPRGDQRSTYRLQLPYRYSLPLLAISILLHWLVSNTIYVVIVEGGYYSGGTPGSSDWMIHSVGPDNSYGLSADAYIGIGFSSGAILLVFCIAVFLLTIPTALGWRKYGGAMVVAGASSVVMSAACHVSLAAGPSGASRTAASSSPTPRSSISGATGGGPAEQGDVEMQNLLSPRAAAAAAGGDAGGGCVPGPGPGCWEEEEDVPEMLRRMRLSRRKLRWGAVGMPAEFYERFRGVGEEVGHLAFGGEKQHVVPPEEGRWYA